MTPAPSVAPSINPLKVLLIAAICAVAALYLGAYFFLLLLKLPPVNATPLTLPRYAYYYWDRPPVRARMVGAVVVGTLIVGGFALLVFLPKRRALHGDARWAKARHIRRAGLMTEHGILLGSYRRRYLTLGGQTGVILAAPPRSGKGVSCVVPNLLNWPGSVLVLDIKKENWDLTAGFRSQFSEVFLFDPFSAEGRTARWNPFTYVSGNPYLRIDDVQRIGTMLLQEVPGSDPFWVKSARSLFVGIALYLFERRDYERRLNLSASTAECIPEVPVTIGEVLRQGMASDEEGFSKHWKRIIEGWAAIGKPLSPQCVSLIMDVVDLATQTASSVRKTFTSQLDLWLNPLLDMATSASDFDLRDLRRRKISIYLGLQPRDFERLQVVMNLFFQQAIGEQTTKLPEHDPSLKYQLLVLLDEFTAIGRIPILLNSIAFVPGYNVRVLIVVQTPSQLDLIYGQDGRKIMLKTLAARIVFPPNDMDDARNISEELGFMTVKSRSRTIPGIGSSGNRSPSTNLSDQRRALMLPQEIKEMSANHQLLFVEHVLPIKCHKIRYYADPIFSKRLIPAPRVDARDATHYQGGRTDDHFRMWEQRLGSSGLAGKTPDFSSPVVSTPERREAEPLNDFSLDFSQVRIPPGRYLSDGEIDSAVDAFLNELESA